MGTCCTKDGAKPSDVNLVEGEGEGLPKPPPQPEPDGSVFLIGSTPNNVNASLLGRYELTTETADGRPVFQLEGSPRFKLFHARGRWWVGTRRGRVSI